MHDANMKRAVVPLMSDESSVYILVWKVCCTVSSRTCFCLLFLCWGGQNNNSSIFFFIFCSVFLKSDRGALWKDRRAAFGPRAAFCFALLYTEPCPRRRIPNSAVELALDLGGPFTLCHRKIRNTFAWPPSCYFSHRNKSRLFYHILLPRKMTGP